MVEKKKERDLSAADAREKGRKKKAFPTEKKVLQFAGEIKVSPLRGDLTQFRKSTMLVMYCSSPESVQDKGCVR